MPQDAPAVVFGDRQWCESNYPHRAVSAVEACAAKIGGAMECGWGANDYDVDPIKADVQCRIVVIS